MKARLDHFFGVSSSGSSIRTELLAGFTTFVTMAYIVIVNPAILSEAGMSGEAVFAATCLVAMLGSFMMGIYANCPIACAPGMGLNAYFAFTIVQSMGYSWQMALGAVFISGCLFVLVCLSGIREILIQGIPESLRIGITAGVGLFLALIAVKSSGLIIPNEVTLLAIGNLHSPEVILASIGFFVIVALEYRKIKGAILISIMIVTFLSFFFDTNQFYGVVSFPPSVGPVFLKLEVLSLCSLQMMQVIFALFLVQMFDATGTMMGIVTRTNLSSPIKIYQLKRALLADSLVIPIGALLGTSSTTAYMESTAGIQAGGKTGLTAVTVGILFFLALFFAPLTKAIPPYATAPALLYVSCLMLGDLAKIVWDDLTELVPAVLTFLMIAFSYSIADGIAFGFIAYTVLKILTGQFRNLGCVVWVITFLFCIRFYFLHA